MPDRSAGPASKLKQAEAEVVPSSGSVQFKLESDSVYLRFEKSNLD